MRPLRFLLALATCIAAFILVLYIGPWRAEPHNDLQEQSKIGTYFNWHTPSSLFPPSAIISLTDDNSTFFLARPAAFGPLIPAKSLSGQLWIGSGFGDDHLGRSGSGGGLEGELGCSDVPGWSDGDYLSTGKSLNEAKSSWAEGQKSRGPRNGKRDTVPVDQDARAPQDPSEADGTDDHLHHPLPASDGVKTSGAKKPTHADIQSLQESAEIAGKVVLLSRGGCGFLEKVKWVQRRGGVALIVGDDIRGGPLVTMYARGDTSNITIPSLFTSHTTAHLLSSLIPSGGVIDSANQEKSARLDYALIGQSHKAQAGVQTVSSVEQAVFTTSSAIAQPTPASQLQQYDDFGAGDEASARSGWLSSLFGRFGRRADVDPETPAKDQVGWVLEDEFDDEKILKYGSRRVSTTTAPYGAPTEVANPDALDGFIIGVQDWRDPDLLAQQKDSASSEAASQVSLNEDNDEAASIEPEVDSITPGSGEYLKSTHEVVKVVSSAEIAGQREASGQKLDVVGEAKPGWLRRLFMADGEVSLEPSVQHTSDRTEPLIRPFHEPPATPSDPQVHEGLWVTLTPTSMSTSPLFDTLLVLVVSPLVTLTVVYALLLLRSRIRRRRWRAPKSVVERLPVRTYQTMETASTTSSTTSSISSPVSATTPLLPSTARPINHRSRPRSRTTPEGPVLAGSSLMSDTMAPPSLDQIEEKRAAGLSEWRRRYGGKQRECVVCLEEYIDGVSRVMSLPCGHEFHAECITPWLTTRRRTCPICKGDVVRSLARTGSASSSPPQAPYHDDENADEVQEQVATAHNDDPAAAQPISRADEMFEDLERGVDRNR